MKKLCLVLCVVVLLGIGAIGCGKKATSIIQPKTTNLPISPSINNTLTQENKNSQEQSNTAKTENLKKQQIATTPMELFNYVTLKTKDEVINKLGKNYESTGWGAEGAMDGYYYKNLGIKFDFDGFYGSKDNGKVLWLECDKKVQVNGTGIGMTINEIKDKLGKAEVKEFEYPSSDGSKTNIGYSIEYIIENVKIKFISYQGKDGAADEIFMGTTSTNLP